MNKIILLNPLLMSMEELTKTEDILPKQSPRMRMVS